MKGIARRQFELIRQDAAIFLMSGKLLAAALAASNPPPMAQSAAVPVTDNGDTAPAPDLAPVAA